MSVFTATAGRASESMSTSAQNGPAVGGVASGASGPVLPPVSLPSGGGTLRGMGDSFNMNAATGTGDWSVPINVSQGRDKFGPSIALAYSSGNGNGSFGLGWNLPGTAAITRKTALGIPRYQDVDDSDVFLLTGQDDLVPVYSTQDSIKAAFARGKDGKYAIKEMENDRFWVRRYRPRTEATFSRIERWTDKLDPGAIHWRVTSSNNITSIFGRDENSRIMSKDPVSGTTRIFSWLLAQSYDCKGNSCLYEYKPEDGQNVDFGRVNERNRTAATVGTQRYLKRIKYGNRSPILVPAPSNTTVTDLDPDPDWMFEVVFDFGEHDLLNPKTQEDPDHSWHCRQDAFSSYTCGFEVRTYRLVQRVLVFHHFPDELKQQDYPASGMEMTYNENSTVSYLGSIQQVGYVLRGPLDPSPTKEDKGPYVVQKLPPLTFQYSQPLTPNEMRHLSPRDVGQGEGLANVPSGVRGSFQWLDLLGEGLSGIFATQDGEWYYKRNLTAANFDLDWKNGETISDLVSLRLQDVEFAPLQSIDQRPSLPLGAGPNPIFESVSGDTCLDIVQMQGPVKGFYRSLVASNVGPASSALGWASFQPFASLPTINVDGPNVRMLDLTGSGKADILVTQDDLFVYYESLGELGFASALNIPFAGEGGHRVLFSDPSETIHLADMSGDGLVDLVRIRNGKVDYWPNCGRGRFGSMVTLDNSPIFDADLDFAPQRLLLCDVDGSGTTDVKARPSRELYSVLTFVTDHLFSWPGCKSLSQSFWKCSR
jgi:hypothetical protein